MTINSAIRRLVSLRTLPAPMQRPDQKSDLFFEAKTSKSDPRAQADFLDRIRRYEHPIDYEAA